MRFNLFTLLFLPVLLFGKTFHLQDTMDGIPINTYMEIFEDKGRLFTIESVKEQPFKASKNHITMHGASSSTWWIRLKVQNSQSTALIWSIRMLFANMDILESWHYSQSQLINHTRKGDHNLASDAQSLYDHAIFTFETQKDAQDVVYIKFSYERAGIIELFSSVWTQNELFTYSQIFTNALVAILSALSVLLFYNFFIFLILKTKIYFWYNLYLFGAILIILSFNQIGTYYIWGKDLFLIDIMPFVSFVLTNISFLLFTRSYLETKKRLKKVDKFITILIVLEITALLLALADIKLISLKIISVVILSFILFPFFGAYLWKKGFLVARGYTLASSFLGVTVALTIFRYAGLLPTSEILYWFTRSGFIFEGILLSVALADRFNLMQHSYNQAQKNLTHSLELKVKQRTLELEAAKRAAEELARKDVLTGIWNRRAFLEMSEAQIHNAHRYDIRLSIIMFDLDHFKHINDNFGHSIGDAVLKAFAKTLNVQARETDIFARIGGEEFVMVLPYSNLVDAKKKADHLHELIKSVSVETPAEKLHITASIGVAQLRDKESLDSLLARADHAMYYVKTNGRDAVYSDET